MPIAIVPFRIPIFLRQSLRLSDATVFCILLAASGIFISVASAQTSNKDIKLCGEGPNADVSIRSCTALIGSGLQFPASLRDIYAARGERYREDGQFNRAVADFDQAIKLAKDTRIGSMLFDSRGEAHQAARQYDLAIADFDQAIKLDPNDGFALVSRGDAYQAKGQSDRAIQDFDQAKKLTSKELIGRTLLVRGGLLIRRNLFDTAVVYFDRAIRLSPNNGFAYARRGFAYKAKGDFGRAIEDFDKALNLAKDRSLLASLLYERGGTYSMKGEYDRAIQDIDHGMEYERNSMGLSFRGNVHSKKGEYALAIRDYDEALQLSPGVPAIFFARSLAKLKMGDVAGAADDRAAATTLDPDIADKMLSLGITP